LSRNNIYGSKTVTIDIPKFNGINTALAFSDIDDTESRDMLNALPNSLGSLAKRPGTIPITNNPLPGAVGVLCNLRKGTENALLATNGATLYKYFDGAFTAQTMTNVLASSAIDAAQFRDANGKEVLVICDGGNLKEYDGTTVKNIVAAANDASPLPPNDLAGINAKKPTGCIVHNTRVVLWNGSEYLWHSKIGYYDYYPSVDYQRFVRENDGIQACVSYRGALMVLMRRHIGVLFGHDRDNWEQDFMDTNDGCLAPKSVQTVTYPNGNQEVFYVSDNGVCAIYAIDTLSLDSSARYSTRSVTVKQVDWEGLGVTKEEWSKAVGHFRNGQYWLIYKKGSIYKGLVFDTRFSQWYPVGNIKATSFYSDEDVFYFAGEDGHLKTFDSTLFSDWNDKAKTAGTPINMYWYSKLLTPKVTGLEHFWDVLMVEAKQQGVRSSIDIEVNTYRGQWRVVGALKTETFVWGLSKWGEAELSNAKFTDMINNAKPLRIFLKGQYCQVKISNDRDEPIEIYNLSFEVRPMIRNGG
jgi:hypothetical protein